MTKFKRGDAVEITTDFPKYPEWIGLVVEVVRSERNWISGKVIKPATPDQGYPINSDITFTDVSIFTLVRAGLKKQPKQTPPSEPKSIKDLQSLADRIGAVARHRDWKKNWSSGGCYIHLEVSEFIEALRGKGDTTPAAEAGDILVALFAVLDWYKISVADVFENTNKAITKLEQDPNFGKYGEV